jgi:hypothetical protein
MKKTLLLAPLLAMGMMLSSSAEAATLTISNATIQLLTSDTAYGGCYATVDKALGTGCAGKTVSFDCDGKYNTNGAGNRHYSTALLAFSLNKPVTLYADTTKKYSGYCVVTRIAVSK